MLAGFHPSFHVRRASRTSRHQMAKDMDPLTSLLSDDEVRHIQEVVRAKCLEAIAIGNLPPGRELELISALDLGTVPWSLVPIKLKEQLGLPFEDKGIDSLALNLTVAVQAKDYSNGKSVPLNRLTNFFFMVKADKSSLKKRVKHIVVATSESTELPKHWQQFSGSIHRKYTNDEVESWRDKAKLERPKEDELQQRMKKDLQRWPHQVECLKSCQNFLKNESQRDFFVQMATGAGKSLVMADLLAGLGSKKRSCIIVPKLDLMEQLAQLLETTLTTQIARVGTGYPANLSADVFVCVRNSAWQLSNLTFDMLILDEAHHYEPPLHMGEVEDEFQSAGIHARQVLALNTPKRIFFSATLRRNEPDFDFGLRPAIQAGVIKDYSVMVPVLTAGDPRPSLVQLIRNLPLARKVLAFCNTVDEAKNFTRMLSAAGIAAEHYNGKTAGGRRQEVLKRFQRTERLAGTRVLVTVDVLSEGVDLPVADTCLFVAPRQGVRLQQCVGRVLRNHSEKVDALVIAPAIQHSDGVLAEDSELVRLLSELAAVDPIFKEMIANGSSSWSRVLMATGSLVSPCVLEDVAKMLRIRVFPHALRLHAGLGLWERGFQDLQAYKAEHGNVLVPLKHQTTSGLNLVQWVMNQRSAKRRSTLSQERVDRLDQLGFVWDVVVRTPWDQGFQELQAYEAEHGNVSVPRRYQTTRGFNLGRWVQSQRSAKRRGTLSQERVDRLVQLGFAWKMVVRTPWDHGFQELQAYKAEHGNVLVPQRHPCGLNLGQWVQSQRSAKRRGTLSQERVDRLDQLGLVWDVVVRTPWDQGVQELQAYEAEHGNVSVSRKHQTTSGLNLGQWVMNQRSAKRRGTLSQERVDRLDQLGFVWDVVVRTPWDQGFQELQAYEAEHGNVSVSRKHQTTSGLNLGQWVMNQRSAKRRGALSQERVDRLDQLGFVWDVVVRTPWDQGFQELQAYEAEHGNMLVPLKHQTTSGLNLGRWVRSQRSAKRRGTLSQERIDRLDQLGFVWDVVRVNWDQGFQELQAYEAEHGNVSVPQSYQTASGLKLGTWVKYQRSAKCRGSLSQERVDSLDWLEFVWS